MTEGIVKEIEKWVKKKAGIGPGRPRKGQKTVKTGTDKNGKDKRKKTVF